MYIKNEVRKEKLEVNFNMKLCYSDEIGMTVVKIDNNGIDFCDGYAYFTTANGEDAKIKIEDILYIH